MAKRQKDDHNHGISLEERELFLNAFYQEERPKTKKENPKTKQLQSIEESDRDLFLRAIGGGVTDVAKYDKEIKVIKQEQKPKAKKHDRIDGKIDLHGMYAQDAVDALLRFIEREQRRGSRVLLVVHGKGAGILKNAVWSMIEAHPAVFDFKMAKGRLGGAGAIVVRLNKKER